MPATATNPDPPAPPSPARSAVEGAWRFALTSVAAFAVWAFAGRWFYEGLGEGALFATTALVFLVLAGPMLAPLLPGPARMRRLYGVFLPAFLAYAVVWSTTWFLIRDHLGEWLASLLSSVAFVAIAGWRLGNLRPFWRATAVFFVTHTIGYFAGGMLAYFLFGLARDGGGAGLSAAALAVAGKLAWGVLYGAGFGAGLGYTFRVCAPTADRSA
jgi:hypothetical protein